MSNTKTIAKRRSPPISKLSDDSLRRLLREANRDDKAEVQRKLLASLRPLLLELMKNKGWSSRRTSRFLRNNNVKAKAVEIDSLLKAFPFGSADVSALAALKIIQPLNKSIEREEK